MKKFLFLLVLLCSATLQASAPEAVKEQQHRSMHVIRLATKDLDGIGVNGSTCTAYAIGAHVLLTAEHCNDPGTLFIDKSWKEIKNDWKGSTPSIVTEKYFDEHDHMLLVIPSATFTDVSIYNPSEYRPPVSGEGVYFWGNPMGAHDMYRQGYVAGVQKYDDQEKEEQEELGVKADVYLFTMPAVGGDSGSSIFSAEDHRIVAVVTFDIANGRFIGAYTLAFTQSQVDAAQGLRGSSCRTNKDRFECTP